MRKENAQNQNSLGLYLKWEVGSWGKWDKEGEAKQGNTGVSVWLDTMSLLWSKHAEIPIAHLTLTWLVSSLIWQACQGGRTNWRRNTQPLIIRPGSSGLRYLFLYWKPSFCYTWYHTVWNNHRDRKKEDQCIYYSGAACSVCKVGLRTVHHCVSRMQRKFTPETLIHNKEKLPPEWIFVIENIQHKGLSVL